MDQSNKNMINPANTHTGQNCPEKMVSPCVVPVMPESHISNSSPSLTRQVATGPENNIPVRMAAMRR
jgi:hypothetical protein